MDTDCIYVTSIFYYVENTTLCQNKIELFTTNERGTEKLKCKTNGEM